MKKNTSSKDNSSTLLQKTIKKNSKYLAAILLLSAVSSVLNSLNPIFYKKIIDEAIPDKNGRLVIICVALMAAIPIISVAVSTLRQRCGYRFSINCENSLRKHYFAKILRMNYPAFIRFGPVKLMTVITRSIGQISVLYLKTDLVRGVSDIVSIIVIFVILLQYSVIIAITTFVVVPVIYFIIKAFEKKVAALRMQELKHKNNLEKYLLQILNGMKTVRSYSGQEKEINSFDEWVRKNADLDWKVEKQNMTLRAYIPTAVAQIVLGCIFTVCAFTVMKDSMTLGTLVAVISYVPQLIGNIRDFMNMEVSKASIMDIVNDLDTLLNEEDEYSGGDKTETVSNGVLAFKNVDFTYGRENFDLKIDNLEINEGDFITIVGTTGGGKSSIMDIINKFYPVTDGCVSIGGKNIDEISTDTLRNHISTMFQDVYMFNGTIAENISYPEKPDMAKINEVMKKAQLSGFVDKLPGKTGEMVKENGANFSGGECQRIALARMLYKDSDIFLLDEPTAALDAGTSKAIFDMLENESKSRGKTVICITHDAGKAVYGNKVIVVNDGRIVEFGCPEELLKQDGAFASLYNAQQKLAT